VLHEWAFLAFQEYAGFETLQPVPDVLGDVHAIGAVLLTDDTRLQYLAIVIIGRNPDLAFQNYKCLGLGGVMMHGNECAWFQAIEETMAFLIKTLMKIVVHPQTW
jgi:hypothetical protein